MTGLAAGFALIILVGTLLAWAFDGLEDWWSE